MVIMGTNIGPEPICTNMRLSIRTTKTVSQYPYDLNVPDVQGAVSKARSLVCLTPRSAVGSIGCYYLHYYLQLIVDSEGLLTMFSLCLMDLSYLTLKETTADHRTVRTQHIVETTHNDDEF